MEENVGFYEMFFVLDGEVKIEFENGKTEVIGKNDLYTMEQNVNHRTSSEKARVFIVCNPPFDIKNVKFRE